MARKLEHTLWTPEINKLITKEKDGVSKAEDAAVKAAPPDTAHALKVLTLI